jgi:hypothetical protein
VNAAQDLARLSNELQVEVGKFNIGEAVSSSGSSKIDHITEHNIEKISQKKSAVVPKNIKIGKKAAKAATPEKGENSDSRNNPSSQESLEHRTK